MRAEAMAETESQLRLNVFPFPVYSVVAVNHLQQRRYINAALPVFHSSLLSLLLSVFLLVLLLLCIVVT